MGISEINDYLLQDILSKLPAKTFASASCVNRAWNHICARILCRPNFISALSLNASLHEAVKEVTDKALSCPIRPQFAIVSICPFFNLNEAHGLIMEKLGTKIPIITCATGGIMGKHALTDEFQEVKFPCYDTDDIFEPPRSGGISLTVGYLPGFEVDVVPLLEGSNINQFVMDTRNFSAAVSGCRSPEAIIIFGDSQSDMKPVIENLDCAFFEQTIIAGNESCSFKYSTPRGNESSDAYAVALVFARHKNMLNGAGKIEFHFAVGAGVTALGPIYRVVSAKMRQNEFTTWLTAKREGGNETLDGHEMLDDLEVEMAEPLSSYDLYIGVRKRRKYSVGSEQVKSMMSLTYHPVQEGDEQYLYVGGWDIKTGDTFSFYTPNVNRALASCGTVFENFGKLKHKEMIGGFVFACCGRGETFFGKPNVDSSPILDNFPTIPLAGMYCGAEIGRGSPNLGKSNEEHEQDFPDTHSHVYSTIYLLMSYSSPSRP
ncbi:unnamed protein product [Amaranthus hypochondriacus]